MIASRKLNSNNLSGDRKPVLKALAGPFMPLLPVFCCPVTHDTETDTALLPRFFAVQHAAFNTLQLKALKTLQAAALSLLEIALFAN